MWKLINLFLASSAHMDAICYWTAHNRADALGAISKAVRLETNEKLLPKHLVYMAEIEVVLGMNEEANINFHKASELISKYSDFWSSHENLVVANKVKRYLRSNA
ncbi:hypothetical protein A9Q81_27685 [Gammaproteobacteria bacterium 42_54_T18]|nr:hypothetical protein A9Q81_27685 [Gammaproteobacteria bacterium 42_54_T18]